jgi:glucan phosphoethanolaminetransferase (alkaline phosphatase superfamily)
MGFPSKSSMYLMHYAIGVVICLLLIGMLIAYKNDYSVPTGLFGTAIALLLLHGVVNFALSVVQVKTLQLETVTGITMGGDPATNWTSLGNKLGNAANSLQNKALSSIDNISDKLTNTAENAIDKLSQTAENTIDDLSKTAESRVSQLSFDEKTQGLLKKIATVS